jgi:hypothetical protein
VVHSRKRSFDVNILRSILQGFEVYYRYVVVVLSPKSLRKRFLLLLAEYQGFDSKREPGRPQKYKIYSTRKRENIKTNGRTLTICSHYLSYSYLSKISEIIFYFADILYSIKDLNEYFC